MARLALVDASPGTATAVRAAASGHDVVACAGDSVPADAALTIVDVAAGASPSSEFLARLSAVSPLLLLLDRRSPSIPACDFLRKPCDIVELRRRIQVLLDAREVPAPTPSGSTPSWARPPRVTASALAFLASARGYDGIVWIAGEPGTGSDHVAADLALAWDDGRLPVLWPEGTDLHEVASQLADRRRVLWAPALDERPAAERRTFERFLPLLGPRRIVVTTGDDADATAALLGPALHRRLSAAALRLAPLRERSGDIAALALETGSAVAAAAFGGARFELADSARRSLEAYEWPGNVEELEAVVTRSVLARGQGAGLVELAEADLRYAPDFAASSVPASPRRAVVLPMTAARGVETASASGAQAAATEGLSVAASTDGSNVEAVLSAFAHDLRNPMSTLKTFASLAAASADGDSGELARLATGAAERIDAHLEFLQRYTEMATGSAAPASSKVDAVDVLAEAIDASGDNLELAARSALWTSGDPETIRFIADSVVAESRDRASGSEGEATADLSADKHSIELRIPVGGAAVDRLGKWVEGRGLPWRLALARDLARRGGGDLHVDVDDGEMRVRWTPAPLVEEAEVGRDGGEARSADRRRRSRSS